MLIEIQQKSQKKKYRLKAKGCYSYLINFAIYVMVFYMGNQTRTWNTRHINLLTNNYIQCSSGSQIYNILTVEYRETLGGLDQEGP